MSNGLVSRRAAKMCRRLSRAPITLRCNLRADLHWYPFRWTIGTGTASRSKRVESAASCAVTPCCFARLRRRWRRRCDRCSSLAPGLLGMMPDEMISLAERHSATVWSSPHSARNSFPENHRLFAGFLAADREKVVRELAGHDLVLVLGAPMFTYHVEGFGPHVPAGAKVFQLVDDPSVAAWAPAGSSVVTSLKLGIGELLSGPQPRQRSAPAPWVRPGRVAGAPLTDKYLVQQIAALRPTGSIVVEEAPSTRGPMHDYLPITERDTFYTCASGGLGHGLPAAVGVSLGRPAQRVVALIGDGSSMYSIQALWSAAQARLPITFVIVNNGRYEALRSFGHHFGLKKLEGTDLPGLDFTSIARGQGVKAERVTTAAELDQALRASFQETGPTLLDVLVA